MKYFKPGLDKATLKLRYRELAKQYHPDLHQDKAAEYTIIMQEINQEYDNYFANIVVPFTATTHQYEQAKQEAKRYRERIILFMVRDKQINERGHFVGFKNYSKLFGGITTIAYHSTGNNWKDFRTGLALCEVTDYDPYGFDNKVERIPATFEMPNFKEILDCYTHWEISSNWRTIHHITTQSGDYVTTTSPTEKITSIMVKVNGEMKNVEVKTSYLGPITENEAIRLDDMFFQEYTGYTYKEFVERYDVGYAPQYADVVGNVPIKDIYFENPMIGFCIRKGVLRLYAAKSNYQMKYGTFEYKQLIEYMPQLTMEDIDEIQDYLDEINQDYEERVKGMIKKGKIRIKI